jgi:hypothetical protein
LDPNGGFDLTNCSQNPTYTYRLRDLRLGDEIEIYYAEINGVNVCDEIRIRYRPGGRVPPVPGRPRRYNRHEYHNIATWHGELRAKGLIRRTEDEPPELPPEERDPKEMKTPQ